MSQGSKKGGVVFSTQLSADIWGHRFREGQRGPEYVLEFLNVMKGTDYDFGASEYYRKRLTGLRKFIFEGDKEGAKKDVVALSEGQKKLIYELVSEKEEVSVIREFFKNLEIPLYDGNGKPANRSWYAKTLYPLHESLLFFELRVKGKSIGYERNFFARGGELYFLMLSYGTENNLDLRSKIEERLKQLLQKNKSIENIVLKISEALDSSDEEKKKPYPLKEGPNVKEYPILPITNDPLYEDFAEEFYRVISLNIDIYEMFELLISLMMMQLTRYMLNRAQDNSGEHVTYFFDCLEAQVAPIQKLAAKSFSDNELLIKNKFESYFSETFNEKLQGEKYVMENLESWKEEPDTLIEHLNLSKLSKPSKDKIKKTIKKCDTYEHVVNYLFTIIKDIVSNQLKRHQLTIIRGIARDGGFGGYRGSRKYRYFMTDTFIQALVFSIVKPQQTMEFNEFLEDIYDNYGYIIGEVQAKKDGIYEKSKLNISYFQKNEFALREKLRYNGLLVEYSDATAMIRNPYEETVGQVVQ